MALRTALTLSAVAAAAAIDANVYSGAWEQVVGTSGSPPTGSFGHAAWTPGYMMLLANDTSPITSSSVCQNPNGCVDLWRYNVRSLQRVVRLGA